MYMNMAYNIAGWTHLRPGKYPSPLLHIVIYNLVYAFAHTCVCVIAWLSESSIIIIKGVQIVVKDSYNELQHIVKTMQIIRIRYSNDHS